MSLHHIDVWVCHVIDTVQWRFTEFYGWPEVHGIHLSLKLLAKLAGEGAEPLVCVEDFNEILFDAKKKGVETELFGKLRIFRRWWIYVVYKMYHFQGMSSLLILVKMERTMCNALLIEL